MKKFYLEKDRIDIARAVEQFNGLCAIYDKIMPVIMGWIRANIGQPAYTHTYEVQVEKAEDGTVTLPALIWSLKEKKEYRLTFTLSSDFKTILYICN